MPLDAAISNESLTTGRFSAIKLIFPLVFSIIVIWYIINPGDTSDLIYTRFIFYKQFLFLRIAIAVGSIYLISINIVYLYLALKKSTVLWLDDEGVRMNGLFDRSALWKDVVDVRSPTPGGYRLWLRNGKTIGIPCLYLHNSVEIARKIKFINQNIGESSEV